MLHARSDSRDNSLRSVVGHLPAAIFMSGSMDGWQTIFLRSAESFEGSISNPDSSSLGPRAVLHTSESACRDRTASAPQVALFEAFSVKVPAPRSRFVAVLGKFVNAHRECGGPL